MNIDKRKMHKLIVTVLLICTKYNEDHAISSKALALISGIDNFELNIMENLIFKKLKYKIFIKEDRLIKYVKYCENYQEADI